MGAYEKRTAGPQMTHHSGNQLFCLLPFPLINTLINHLCFGPFAGIPAFAKYPHCTSQIYKHSHT